MGTWGAGNFENDSACDYLVDAMGRWIKEVDQLLGGKTAKGGPGPADETGVDEIEGEVMPAVELMALTIERLDPDLVPDPKKIAGWSRRALKLYDSEIDEYGPDEDYKVNRRGVIAETFDRLLAIVKRHSEQRGGDPQP